MERALICTLSCAHLCARQSRQLLHTHTIPNPCFDVIVSGGGMIGAAMTSALANCVQLAGKKILMLEGGPEKQMEKLQNNFSSRTVALSPKSIDLLKEIGAWEHIEAMRCQPVKRMQVWDSCSESHIDFNNPGMMDAIAYIVENDVIQEGIRQTLHSGRIEVRYKANIEGYTLCNTKTNESSAGVQVHLGGGETLKTRLLIGADGFHSLVRKTAGFHTLQWDYDQLAVVATLKLSEPTENNVAWQRFLPSGPAALLPLSQDYSCLIWSLSRAAAEKLLRLDPDSFVDAVNRAFWSDETMDETARIANKFLRKALNTVGIESRYMHQLPPTLVKVDEKSRAAFPLGFMHSSHYVMPRVALIGDAAHRCHPMAGQGVNLGFGDVLCLRDEVQTALCRGSDLGSLQHLLTYETNRQKHVVPTLLGIDALHRLYQTSWTPAVLSRSFGLQITNSLTEIKKLLMSHAMSG